MWSIYENSPPVWPWRWQWTEKDKQGWSATLQIQRQAAQITRKAGNTELCNDVKSTVLNMKQKDYREMPVFKEDQD